ncbi:MAG: radical SAM protein [Ruminococcus sp.]|nr:radical SAM protein [Ruminococcus sp.]
MIKEENEVENIFKLSDDWGDLTEHGTIVPFGVGRIGRRVIPSLMEEFDIPFLIDNGCCKESVYGLNVLNLKQAVTYLREKNLKVVVTTVFYSYKKIKQEMESLGFIENRDFCILERFAEEWNLRWRNKCVLSKIDTVITSRCTLRCKNCNLFISHAPVQCDIDLKRLKKNFDIFFESVDYVYEYTLLGGEPLLHKSIAEIISYLGNRYGKRIGRINLISNGTVIPSNDVIDLLKKYHVTIHISDYTCSVDYKEILAKLQKKFLANDIEYYVIPNNTWKDVIYPREGFQTDNPRRHMLLCGHSTHSVADGRLYWCDPAFAAECFMGFVSKEDDSLDMEANKRNYSKYEATLNIIKYLLGDVNARGYMSICEKCAGVGSDNNKIVLAGEQAGREV